MTAHLCSLTPLLLAEATAPAAEPVSVTSAMLILIGIALGFVWSLLVDIRRRLERIESRLEASPHAVVPSAAVATPAPAPRPDSGAITPQVVAAIAAAVHATLGGRHRIVSVTAQPLDTFAWSLEGRRTVLHSHKVR